MKNTVEGINRLNDIKEQVSNVKQSSENHWFWTKGKKRIKRNENNLKDLWHKAKHSHYRGPKMRRKKGAENIFEDTIAENFSNWERKQTSKSRRGREFCTGLTQRGTHTKTLKMNKTNNNNK